MAELKFAFRQLLKNPGFTTVAVLTLALGIGANTAIFSILNAVLLRPLPFLDPKALVELNQSHRKDPLLAEYGVSGPNYKDWQATSRSFSSMGIQEWAEFWLTRKDHTSKVRGQRASASLFETLGRRPILGRGFQQQDERAGGVVLLGNDFWKRQFGADTNLLGEKILLNDEPHTVVGILPPTFWMPGQPELWVPIPDSSRLMTNRGWAMGRVVGRLKPGLTIRQAQAEMEMIAERLSKQYPAENKDWSVRVSALHGKVIQRVRPALPVLSGVAGFVLLIACANMGNLLLARATGRQKEIAIRAALGAGRAHLFRQLITESAVLSVIGGTAGLLVLFWSQRLIAKLIGPYLPHFAVIELDATVFGFALLITLLTGLFSGLFPGSRILMGPLNESLCKASHRNSTDLAGSGPRSGLVVSEVALATVLLVGAGLTLRSLSYLLNADLRINPANVLAFEVALPDERYPAESPQRTQFFEEVLARIKALPDVKAAAVAMFMPYASRAQTPVVLEGRPENLAEPARWTGSSSVSPDFFDTIGLLLLEGRGFTKEDRRGAPEVAIVNETMARRYWPGENVIGKRFAFGRGTGRSEWFTIVGVVRDLRPGGTRASMTPDVYRCSYQSPWFRAFVVRTSGNPLKLIARIQGLLESLDKRVVLEEVETLDRVLDDSASDCQALALLLLVFAGLALALSTVGIYGVISYCVAQRRHELGVRLALGAQKKDLAILVLSWGGRLTMFGTALGLLLSCWLARILVRSLSGVSATDAITLTSVSLISMAVAFAACLIPARRAARIDPIQAIRYE